jgi:hypothetical protein
LERVRRVADGFRQTVYAARLGCFPAFAGHAGRRRCVVVVVVSGGGVVA